MSQLALFNGEGSRQDEVHSDMPGQKHAASVIEHLSDKKRAAGMDPSPIYSQFLVMYHFPILRDYKPSVLAAPGVIPINQQGGNPSFGGTVNFRHTQAGDLTRFSQLNFNFSDVSCSDVAYSGINQLLSDVGTTNNYSIYVVTLLSNPGPIEAAPAADATASQLQNLISTIEMTPCRPSGELIRIGENIRNHVVLSDYPGERAATDINTMVGTNEYIKYNEDYPIVRRHLLPENKRHMHNELVGEQCVQECQSEEATMVEGRPSVFGAANEVEFLSAANKIAAEAPPNLFSANSQTLLNKFSMRANATASTTVYEKKLLANGFQTPKPSHSNVVFSVPIYTHSTVDSDNALSNMTFASFIRVYQVTLAQKLQLFKVVPGGAAVRYKASIIVQQQRSYVGYVVAAGTVVNADASAADAAHQRLTVDHVLSETEAILPATISGSAISGGDIQSLEITTGQVYLNKEVRHIIEHQSSVTIYHLPDMHKYSLTTSGSSFTVNSNDGRWVSKALYILPYPEWNRDQDNNPYSHRTWHEGSFADVVQVPKSLVFDVPQHQTQHLTSLYDIDPTAHTAAASLPQVPAYLAASVTAIQGQLNAAEYQGAEANPHLTYRFLYQAPIRKQVISGWSNFINKRIFMTSIGLKIQSFEIYEAKPSHVVSRSSFYYSNQGVSPRDKAFHMLPLSLKPLDETVNSGGLNLSKYRDVIFTGAIDTTVISALNQVSNNTAAMLAICSYCLNVLITTQRTQYRRFSN